MSTLHLGAAGWPAELDLACQWYLPFMEQHYEDAAHREADITQLAQIAASYPTRERFLTELTLDPPDATSDQAGPPLLDEDYLILSTIHSAKGQEWSSVFVLNVVDGCIPSDLGVGSTPEIEEERRLLYVAMTRAKDQLHLMVPQRFFTHGQRSSAIVTSMRSARGSFRMRSPSISRAGIGRDLKRPALPGARRERRST
jgi:DNA helicase-2/ATP-dependent DNA helicase PcrA